MTIALSGCWGSDSPTTGHQTQTYSQAQTQAQPGKYNRNATCQNIVQQLGVSGDNIYDAEYSDDPSHQRLVQLYKANGCDK